MVPELDTRVFLIPGNRVKNGDDRLVVLSRVARSVLESVRGVRCFYVFVYRGCPIETMHNTPWQSARRRAGLRQVRVHDLKHRFGRRLRAVGACRSRIARTCSRSARGASPRTTRRPSSRT